MVSFHFLFFFCCSRDLSRHSSCYVQSVQEGFPNDISRMNALLHADQHSALKAVYS